MLTKIIFKMVLLKRIMPLSLRPAFEKQFPKQFWIIELEREIFSIHKSDSVSKTIIGSTFFEVLEANNLSTKDR